MDTVNINFETGLGNFINVADYKSAISSFGEVFKVGDTVILSDTSEGGTAIIESFQIDGRTAEVLVLTTKGSVHLDFISHVK